MKIIRFWSSRRKNHVILDRSGTDVLDRIIFGTGTGRILCTGLFAGPERTVYFWTGLFFGPERTGTDRFIPALGARIHQALNRDRCHRPPGKRCRQDALNMPSLEEVHGLL